MAFQVSTEMNGKVAKVTLVGDLDGSSAPAFKEAIEAIDPAHTEKLVLFLDKLEYMASAGLRVLIFARQKMGTATDLYAIAPQEMVLETMKKTGFIQSVIVADTFEG